MSNAPDGTLKTAVLQHGKHALEAAMGSRLNPGAAVRRIARRDSVGQLYKADKVDNHPFESS